MTHFHFHNQMITIIRSLGLHHAERTPCGQPLSISEAHTIMELHKKKRLTQTELTQILQLEKSSVSRLLQQLERKGWLEREASASDQRVKLLKLSEKGENVAHRLDQSRKEKFDRIAANIPEEKLEQVVESMNILIRAIDEENKKGDI
ncbi:MarR family winged helix-turn-helix transcriptional regulator [Caldalkalibacillus mannanilyticus]|uniref:MarR family winged helix-turn-helix transcriptional regulator n=1 Tax=Caldalkalibacillus mannanilyticus TaxID=1418 RepID=UPI000468A8E1|nr:MarR family transcriptional regulator [Caldalkalibacillus mannanilyticus]